MDFNPIGMGTSGVLDVAKEICACQVGGFGCGTWAFRHLCKCQINGCGCGWGAPGTG